MKGRDVMTAVSDRLLRACPKLPFAGPSAKTGWNPASRARLKPLAQNAVSFRHSWGTACVRGGRPEGAKHPSPGRSPGSGRPWKWKDKPPRGQTHGL